MLYSSLLTFQDSPYDKDDDVIKATSFEVISTLRDVLKTSSLWRDHVQTYTQVCMVLVFLIDLVKNSWKDSLHLNFLVFVLTYPLLSFSLISTAYWRF